MNFPANPTLNQEHTYAGTLYRWNGTSWQSVGGAGGGGGGTPTLIDFSAQETDPTSANDLVLYNKNSIGRRTLFTRENGKNPVQLDIFNPNKTFMYSSAQFGIGTINSLNTLVQLSAGNSQVINANTGSGDFEGEYPRTRATRTSASNVQSAFFSSIQQCAVSSASYPNLYGFYFSCVFATVDSGAGVGGFTCGLTSSASTLAVGSYGSHFLGFTFTESEPLAFHRLNVGSGIYTYQNTVNNTREDMRTQNLYHVELYNPRGTQHIYARLTNMTSGAVDSFQLLDTLTAARQGLRFILMRGSLGSAFIPAIDFGRLYIEKETLV